MYTAAVQLAVCEPAVITSFSILFVAECYIQGAALKLLWRCPDIQRHHHPAILIRRRSVALSRDDDFNIFSRNGSKPPVEPLTSFLEFLCVFNAFSGSVNLKFVCHFSGDSLFSR